ncbi:MAG: hypothetical protein JXJ04_20635 [Spirochaetales bacterium]|nr:hypothetical protein [Spirochaetales bacterium]
MNRVKPYQSKREYTHSSRKRIVFIFFLIILASLFLISCTSTPVKDQDSDSDPISSNNKDTKTTSSEKGTSHTTKDTRSTKYEDTDKRKMTSYKKDDSGSGIPSLFNFITHRGMDSLTEGEDYFIYILIYGSLFSFIYVAIILRIIHRRQKK